MSTAFGLNKGNQGAAERKQKWRVVCKAAEEERNTEVNLDHPSVFVGARPFSMKLSFCWKHKANLGPIISLEEH